MGETEGERMSQSIPTVDPYWLLDEYDGLLIDAYGVLVHASGSVPGAGRFLEAIHSRGVPYRIITNDASRLEVTTARSYEKRGISVAPEAIITAGSLISSYIDENSLVGAKILVLGSDDSLEYVRRAGAEPLLPDGESLVDGIVVADEAFEPFLQGLDLALTQLMKSYDMGRDVELICPNPDALYPASPTRFGFASGSFAALFEHAIESRLGERRSFARLGKPFAPMYRKAVSELPGGRYAALGDQLPTDIKGARDFGLDAYLSLHGVATRAHAEAARMKPTGILAEF